MPNTNMNYTSSAGLVPASVQEFMYRNFLNRVLNNRVWGRDFQPRTLPLHNGRRVVFAKMQPFDVSVDPLKEGVTPDGQTVATSTFTATVKPYGQYVAVTDEIDWALIDGVKREISLRLGDQAADTLDAIDRNAICAGTNVQYGGTATSRAALAAGDKLTYNDVRKAVRTLKKNKARPFADGYYHAIVDAETIYDLMGDSMFVDISKYQDKTNLERGEIGKMYGVKFFETTNPMTYAAESYLYDSVASLALTGWDAATKIASIAASSIGSTAQDHAHFIRRMAGRMVTLWDASANSNAGTTAVTGVIDHCEVDGSTMKVYFRWTNGTLTFASGDLMKPMADTLATAVHATVVYGQDAAGGVDLAGGGKNIEMKIKPCGSSGTDDPLDQRGTLGWKVRGYTATVLQDGFVVRIEHGVTA